MTQISKDQRIRNRDAGEFEPESLMESFYDLDIDGDNNTGIDFWKILRVLRKWWWLIGLIVITGILAMLLALSRVTPVYKAVSTLEIKQQSRNIIDVSDVESVIADREFVATQVELLKSQKLAEDVVISLNLINDPDFLNPDTPNIGNLPRELKIRMVTDVVRNRLDVTSVGGSRLIKVSFEHTSARRAALIVNTITESFINNSMSRKFNSTVFARKFLEERLLTVKASLEGAERDLFNYASENDIIIVNGDGDQGSTGALDVMELVTLKSKLTLASLERVEAEAVLNAAEKEVNLSTGASESQLISELRSKRTDLYSEYLEKLSIFKPKYPEMVELKSRIDLFDAEIKKENERVVGAGLQKVKMAYELAKGKEADLIVRVNALKNSVESVREKSINYNILERQVEIERSQYEALLQRLKEVSVSDEVGSNLVEIVDRAKTPRSPFKPNRLQSLLLAFIGASGLAFGLVFSIDAIDDRIRTPEDIKTKLNQTIMGAIPLERNTKLLQDNIRNPQSSLSEAYAALRTNIQFSGPNGGPRVLQLTSTRSGEGKSVSSIGIATRFAGLGQRVLLIDADMRRPTFSTEHKTTGLSGVLTSMTPFEEQVVPAEHTENLDLLTSGSAVPNPSEILSTYRFEELVEWARENYEYIIVDSPPVLGLADAPLLGAKVDATLLIVEASQLRTPNVKASIDRLRASRTKLLGVVLTKYTAPSGGYSDYYLYSYGKNSESSKPREKEKRKSVKPKTKMKP